MRAQVIAIASGEKPPPDLSDDALIAACAAGERAALAILFDRHGRTVRRFCARLAGAEHADDLLQSTFLAAWSQVRRYRGRSSVRAWLLGIAGNMARKLRRQETRRRNLLGMIFSGSAERRERPDDRIAHGQTLDRLALALAALPHDLRVAFVMCEIEEISGAEAARVLGVPAGTVWRRVHEARRRLLPLLEGEGT